MSKCFFRDTVCLLIFQWQLLLLLFPGQLLLQTAFLSHTDTYRQLQLFLSLFNTFTVLGLVTRVKKLSSVLSWNGKCSRSGRWLLENNSSESTFKSKYKRNIFRQMSIVPAKQLFFVPYDQRLFSVIWSHLTRHLQVWIIYSVGKCGVTQSVLELCCVYGAGWLVGRALI